MSSSLKAGIADPQNDVSTELEAEGITNENSAEKTKAIIEEGVQMALEELKEC